MRLRAVLFAIVVLAAAAGASWKIAELATARYEAGTAAQMGTALKLADQTWATATTDGLKVTLSGAAPDESSHFRALEVVRQVVDARRIEDATTVAAAAPLPPAPFALELLRSEDGVSLIGLVPEAGGRDVIGAALRAGGLAGSVTDMLETASDPAPAGWSEALGFGLSILAELPRAKVSVAPRSVRVVAVADSEADRKALEARLERAKPEGVTLVLELSAPRAVIAPFAFDLALRDGVGRLDACSADSDAEAGAILAAARALGAPADAGCKVGLGAPSPDWGAAVAAGLEALGTLKGGRFALHDLSAELTPPDGAPAAAVTEAAARLDAALPDAFRLAPAAPAAPASPPAAGDVPAAPPPAFGAELAADGQVRLTGAVPDATSRDAILSYAASLFGHDKVMDTTEIAPGLPAGWPVRVLAGVEALSALRRGALEVTPDTVSVEGWGIDAGVRERVSDILAAKVGDAARVDVTYNAAAAAAAEQAARPKPEICADQIAAILDAGSIQFAAGSADIVPESRGVIAAIADVLRGCPGADFEIGGHTDAQGPAEANQRLSDRRAEAVLAALRAEDLPAVGLSARGYGAAVPVADNATDTGRASNRRIEFSLVDPDAPPAPAPDATEPASDPGETPGEVAAEATAACADEIGAILADTPLQFAGGAATLSPESAPVIEAVAGALQTCPDTAFEVGGYTDSQGSDSGNLRLSQERAEAVLAALRARGMPLAGSVAKGYGEADPVADNATADGRASNRRIAFAAIPAPAPSAAPTDAGEAPTPAAPDAACVAAVETIVSRTPIQFAAGSAEIAPESGSVLEEIATGLRACPAATLEIAGHTDSEGSESGNQRLSQQRADAVLAALRARGLPLANATARGYGESRPVADNATAEGRAQNRRIVFGVAGGADDEISPAEPAGDETGGQE